MNAEEREQTIQQIVGESRQQPKEPGKHRVLIEWRAKLEQEPKLLPPCKIDEISRPGCPLEFGEAGDDLKLKASIDDLVNISTMPSAGVGSPLATD